MTEREILDQILKHEGAIYHKDKFTNYDTKFGISARTHAHLDLRNLTGEQALIIHRRDFYQFYKIKDLNPKLRGIVYTAGIMLGFPESFRLLSQAVDYFPLKESLTPELLSAVELSNPEAARARMGSLLIFWFADHFGGNNLRAIVPRILESIST